ncbi:thioesterase II family protein [Actinomadura mexicana]|uniref:Surfactin synthase thioesterase subunit n=1 Tax=Actinomadura mexicana TaxID=134959 RepID=A0A238XMH3_9ACTN|nr:alpha/beta fold hydrolase [Actinomadura mexicana]SNR59798.1 Surfactin synthase thioesterase subunit [Actinomadura mexicana]
MSTPDRGGWIRSFGRVPGEVRLFCFPHAGGAASYFYPWSGSLGPGIELLAVQYPGRQDRGGERCAGTIAELADRIHGALGPWLPETYAFFGHSMGAVVAFEVASRIAREGGRGPAHLFASGRRAPSRHRHEDLHRADTPAFLAELRSLGGTDPRILADEELLNLTLPTVRADYAAVETYRFDSAPPLTCDITALVGDRDPKTGIDEAAAWGRHTTGKFDLRVYPGGHFYLNDCRAGLLDVISSSLSAR